MKFSELITSRRSCRAYQDKAIADNDIKHIVETALLSPTSKNNRPWEFIIVNQPSLLFKLSESKPHGSAFLKDAPLGIVIIADPNKSDVWIEDTSIAGTVIQLVAEDVGLGSCWIQIRKREHDNRVNASDYVKDVLNIPDHFEVASIIAVGHKRKERKPYSHDDINIKKIHYNQYLSELS